ncbi:MAG TPA: polysaccharide deacetylase family protein, partial [Thermoanaerobaculia bacterium]|nr:polysaccharide deacetylase family protein [Thermoanaerobaculia bacterium]
MIPICLYFQVHQPYRLRRYNYFDVGREHRYFDDERNREVLLEVAGRCYLPATAMLERLLTRHPRFSAAFSLSGTLLEQLQAWSPPALDAFRRLAATGRVEFLAETSHHSLAWLASREEFTAQVALHRERLRQAIGAEPSVFRNTELIYSDALAACVEELGFRGVLADGV